MIALVDHEVLRPIVLESCFVVPDFGPPPRVELEGVAQSTVERDKLIGQGHAPGKLGVFELVVLVQTHRPTLRRGTHFGVGDPVASEVRYRRDQPSRFSSSHSCFPKPRSRFAPAAL